MGKRKHESAPEVIRRTAPEVFAVLSAAGFGGLHDIEGGVAYVGSGFRFRSYLTADRWGVAVVVDVDLLHRDGSVRGRGSLGQLFAACGLRMPNAHGAGAGSATVTERRVRWYGARIGELLPSLLAADPDVLHRNLHRGFAEPDLRALARLGRPRRDEARRSPFATRALDASAGRAVRQYTHATPVERVAMRAVVNPAGAEALRAWAAKWEEFAERADAHHRPVDLGALARELAGDPPHASPSASRPVK